MKTTFILLLIWAALLTPFGGTQETSPNVTELSTKNIDFAMDLYRLIASHHDDNIFFSPLCMSTAFSVLAMGARSSTREQILKGLRLDVLDRDERPELLAKLFRELQSNITQDGGLQLNQGTALFVRLQFEVSKAFSDQMQEYFNADILNVDFANSKTSKATINDYIKHKTGDKVTDMISKIDPYTQLILVNTIFFQGNWELPFIAKSTTKQRFYVDKYNIVQVPMMYNDNSFYVARDANLKMRLLKLPYLGGAAMLIVLPEKTEDYTAIDDHINAEVFQGWLKQLKKTRMEVNLPRFKMEQSYEMHKILPDLGISDVFTNSANLSGISTEFGLKVSEVLHKAVIEVDETGTTAAAATTTGIVAKSMPLRFVVDRPFFFFIYHEVTNTILFMGRVIDPTKM
ncbi:serpin peptidase inhibitor, clade A (alpha-1 antiproteinase, antitrypsin), member 10a [Scleropages formosus]|uniref:Serpin family A member 10 n=1 Tax=Scleropages formosus TaxID=113540 RepID=A0A8C9S300_SCLFO|nr:protein Z-dependent protease inhibitor-like [Scleropages formosus]XP_018583360.1 protein Z-dependent protease inhibitor-like [Scleropages formosus]XP_018583361.1 protein Z-dependent protease inhibitor-like [Scleropages formosus]